MEKMTIRRKSQTTPATTGIPWLVFPGGKDRKKQTFCTLSSSSSSSTISISSERKSIPELGKAEIWACQHGWLLLTYEDDDYLWILWNPTSYESIKLPPLDKKMIRSSIFTKPPNDPGCRVLLLERDRCIISYCQPGDQDWIKYGYRREVLEMENIGVFGYSLLSFSACVNGVIYAETASVCLVSIEFENQTGLQIKRVTLEQPRWKFCPERGSVFSVESCGELFLVYLNLMWNEIFGIDVFKWDFTRKVWLEVNNLDGRVLLGSEWNSTSSCLEEETGIRGNRVYFMMPNDKHIYMYELEEARIMILLPCPKLQTPWYKPFWVMVDHQVKLPHHKTSNALEENTELVVESQTCIDASADQYPDYLNLDILTVIVKHLQPLGYLEFRATGRLFLSAAPVTQRSITSIMGSLESPWLVTSNFNRNVISFTDPIHNKPYHLNVPESLRGTYINGSKDGYLLMVYHKNLVYFNPFTGTQVKLPTPYFHDNRLSFSSSPSSSNCIVVKLYRGTFVYRDISEVEYILPGRDYWLRQQLHVDKQVFTRNGLGVFHRGVFYYLGKKGNLGVLKVADEFSFETLVKPEVPCNGFYHNYLAECNGELIAIFVGRNGSWVKVFRLDHQEMSWRSVRNLGNYALFVSSITSIAAVAKSPRMVNKVYFPRFFNDRMVYYSLDTEKFHTHGSDVAFDNFVDTKEQLYCTWIEPALD